jgi:hypothetical protein
MNPYRTQALDYFSSGLGYPIPSTVPYEKFPPLTGWTGRDGAIPSKKQVVLWMDEYPDSNILLRLAPDVIGIDVDDYDYKHGAATIFKASKVHGHLADSPFSTARGPGYSGIRLYRLDATQDERRLKGDLGPDSHVEVIRYSHRYAVVPPSWHQGAEARYGWYNTATEKAPNKDALPYLTDGWYMHLRQTCSCFYEQRKAQREQLSRYKRRPLNSQGRALAQMDLDNNMSLLERMPKGGRNNYLSRVAGRTFLFDCLMNNVLDPDRVWTELLETALDAGLKTEEITATLHSARSWAISMDKENDNGNES